MRWTLLVLVGCGRAPYPDYWADPEAFPVIDAVEPAVLDSRTGGQQIRIVGARLGDTRTVVIGGRNASIVATGTDFVEVRVPALGTGPDAVEVALATTDGLARLEEGLRYETGLSTVTAEERLSASLWTVWCPAEVWATDPGGAQVPVDYCGPAQSRAGALGIVSPGLQSGYAGDLSGIVPLSGLPPVGAFRVISPGEVAGFSPPLLYAPTPAGDRISITTLRHFERDLQAAEDQLDRLALYHSQPSLWVAAEPVFRPFDDEVCLVDDFSVLSALGDALEVSGDATGAQAVWIGAAEAGQEGFVATARLSSAVGGSLVGLDSGVDLRYSLFEGAYLPVTAAGFLGVADLPPDVSYEVRTTHLDEEISRGAVMGVQALQVTAPEVFTGSVVVPKDQDLVIQFAPGTDEQAVLGVEIRVWDADVQAPNGQTQEVTRLIARADDAAGELIIPAHQLFWLPTAANRVDANGNKIGRWATLTIARHAPRQVGIDEGDLVIDFVDAAELPILLEEG